eukprot:1139024-Pelagomonas_calceolata.AAC.4
MEWIAFKVDTGEGCVCRGVITLNSLRGYQLQYGSGPGVSLAAATAASSALTMKMEVLYGHFLTWPDMKNNPLEDEDRRWKDVWYQGSVPKRASPMFMQEEGG